MAFYWHVNNAHGELREAYAPGDGRLKLKPGQAASFGDPTELAPLRIPVYRGKQCVTMLRCYGRDGDDLLVSGPIDGFSDSLCEAGLPAWNTPTAADFADLQAAIEAILDSLVWASVVDADGKDWMGVAPVYFTAPGVSPVQVVDTTHGLPVSIVGEINFPSEMTVSLADGSAVAITQGGALNVGVSGTVAVAQATAANLNMTAHQGGVWAVAVEGAVATTQSGLWGVGLEAGSNLVGKVAAGVDGSTIYNGTTPATPQFAKINASSIDDNLIVPAIAGKRIRVLRWGLSASEEVTATWRSGSTDITGARTLPKYAAVGGAYCPVGVFETGEGEALNLNLSTSVGVGGELTYVLI